VVEKIASWLEKLLRNVFGERNLPQIPKVVFQVFTIIMIVVASIYVLFIIVRPKLFIKTMKGVWYSLKELFRQINGFRGYLSFAVVWLILSGIGAFFLGIIIRQFYVSVAGLLVFLFWAGPATPLLPLVFALGLVVQRYIFRDKKVSWNAIKEQFKLAFQKENEESETENQIENELE
jgi:hypothetical protein